MYSEYKVHNRELILNSEGSSAYPNFPNWFRHRLLDGSTESGLPLAKATAVRISGTLVPIRKRSWGRYTSASGLHLETVVKELVTLST